MATLNIKNFPEALYEALKSLAKEENRSVTQQVIHLLARALESSEPTSILELRGLGRKAWNQVDASQHVETERRTWD
jgi:hypothetical protein